MAALPLLALSAAACSADAGTYPIEPSQDVVSRGKPLYQAHCATCHGDATARPPLKAAPTHQADGHTWHHPDRLLVQWVLDGVPMATTMQRFRGELSEDDVRSVIAYIKTFWPDEVRRRQEEGSRAYEGQLRE